MKHSSVSKYTHKNRVSRKRLGVFRSLFVARADAYAISTGQKILARRNALSEEVLRAHLNGEYRVGTYLVQPDNCTPFMVIDIDIPKRRLVRRICRRLRKRGATPYVERSKSKGFHIWVFFERPVSAAHARAFGHRVLHGLKSTKIELFPKQDRVTGDGLGIASGILFLLRTNETTAQYLSITHSFRSQSNGRCSEKFSAPRYELLLLLRLIEIPARYSLGGSTQDPIPLECQILRGEEK